MPDHSSNIVTRFTGTAAAHPEAIALLQDGESISYKRLADEVEWTAARFRNNGIGKGDKILVFVPMSIGLYRTVLALLRLGACPVFLDEWVSLARLKACLQTVPCRGLIAGMKLRFIARFIPSLRNIPVRISGASGNPDEGSVLTCQVSPNDTALVTFTTGSTGIPKAADRTHAFLQAQLEALDPLLAGVSSPCLTTLPIVVLLHLARGRTTLLPPSKFKAAKSGTFETLAGSVMMHRPQSLIMSPAIIDALLNLQAKQGCNTEFIDSILTGGGPVYPDLAGRLCDAFPAAKITAVYGSTEAEPISHIDARQLRETPIDNFLRDGLPLGHPDPAATVRILRPVAVSADILSGASLTKNLEPGGEPGEIIVSGAHVLRHYINNPQAESETKIRIGQQVWHRTGDCGRLDGDGNLYLLGRVSEIIDWRGRQLFPATLTYLLRVEAGIDISALMESNGQLLLIVEKQSASSLKAGIAALERLGIAGIRHRIVKSIPRDPRHRTKVDYATLRKKIS